MPLTIADAAWGFVVPAIIACALMLLLRRFLPGDAAERYAAPVAVMVAFLAGYGMLALGPWQPTLHWQWLPYLAVAATLIGATALASGVRLLERWLLYALIAVAAAWFLVPDWEDLEPSWSVHVVVLTVYVTLLSALLQPLAARLPGPLVGTVLSLCMVVVAVVMVPAGSLRFLQVAGAVAGGYVGCTIATMFLNRRGEFGGIALLFAVLTAGLMLSGRANSYSGVPLVSYLLPPLAPLGLWFAAGAWESRWPGRTGSVVAAILVILPLAVAVGLAVRADMGGDEGY